MFVTTSCVTKIPHTAAKVAFDNIRAFTCWIMGSAQLVGCASLLEQSGCIGAPLFFAQGQTFIIAVGAVV